MPSDGPDRDQSRFPPEAASLARALLHVIIAPHNETLVNLPTAWNNH